MSANFSRDDLISTYMEQRYPDITSDYSRACDWIWEALTTFAHDMTDDELREAIQDWEDADNG